MKRAFPAFLVFMLGVVSARAQSGDVREPTSVQAWQMLSPQRRQEILRNLERYEAMAPKKKELIRARYAQFRKLAPEQKKALLRRWSAFKALPPERQKAIKAELETHGWAQEHHEGRQHRQSRDRIQRAVRRGEPRGASHHR